NQQIDRTICTVTPYTHHASEKLSNRMHIANEFHHPKWLPRQLNRFSATAKTSRPHRQQPAYDPGENRRHDDESTKPFGANDNASDALTETRHDRPMLEYR